MRSLANLYARERRFEERFMSKSTRVSPHAEPVIVGAGASAKASSGDGVAAADAALADVHEMNRLVREAEDARRQTEQAIAAKDELLASLAHELRSPLASMLLHAQLLREGDVRDRAGLKRIGESIERAVQQQAQLIERLLDNPPPASDEPTPEDRVQNENAAASCLGVSSTLTSDQMTPQPRRSLDRPGKVKQYEALKDIRILYIDDDFRTREAVLEVLELTGAQVALAASTADGMMALDTFKPHVILCDLAMPGEDGYAFMRKLRVYEMGRVPQIPVLAFTGLASAADKRDALAAGFQLHLAKPIDIDRLRDSVLQLVGLLGSTTAV